MDAQNVIETALGGKQATEIWEGERKYPVTVRLRDLDKVAYVRFASVYRQFEDVDQFMKELKDLLEQRK